MTFKKQTVITSADNTQVAEEVPTKTEKIEALPTQPTVDQYLAQFRASDDDGTKTSLRFKEGFNPKPWQFRAFRHDEVMNVEQARRIKNDGFVQIKRNGGIFGQAFEDWLEEDAWNGENLTQGMLIDRATRQGFPELYWFVRPIAAYIARQKVESEHSGKYVNIKQSERKQGQWAGERNGLVTVNEFDAGDESDPAGW